VYWPHRQSESAISGLGLVVYQHLLDAGAQAWQQLTPETLRSVCACDYVKPELER